MFLLFGWPIDLVFLTEYFADFSGSWKKCFGWLVGLGRREKIGRWPYMASMYIPIGQILRSREKWPWSDFCCRVWLLELWNSNIKYLPFPCVTPPLWLSTYVFYNAFLIITTTYFLSCVSVVLKNEGSCVHVYSEMGQLAIAERKQKLGIKLLDHK